MCMPITIEQAIKILSRYDTEFYTPEHRMAHRMAVEALKEQIENQNKVNTDNINECTDNS